MVFYDVARPAPFAGASGCEVHVDEVEYPFPRVLSDAVRLAVVRSLPDSHLSRRDALHERRKLVVDIESGARVDVAHEENRFVPPLVLRKRVRDDIHFRKAVFGRARHVRVRDDVVVELRNHKDALVELVVLEVDDFGGQGLRLGKNALVVREEKLQTRRRRKLCASGRIAFLYSADIGILGQNAIGGLRHIAHARLVGTSAHVERHHAQRAPHQ